MNSDEFYRTILGSLGTRRSVFVSYHHGGDRAYYHAFSRLFADNYEVIQDNSVEREIDSNDAEYFIRRIREEFITGSSCTVVLCSSETPQRKFVDWEIKATLDKEHGLIGINLPTNPLLLNGNVAVPNRLFDNIQSGYAIWTNWQAVAQNPAVLTNLVEQVNARSKTPTHWEVDLTNARSDEAPSTHTVPLRPRWLCPLISGAYFKGVCFPTRRSIKAFLASTV